MGYRLGENSEATPREIGLLMEFWQEQLKDYMAKELENFLAPLIKEAEATLGTDKQVSVREE